MKSLKDLKGIIFIVILALLSVNLIIGCSGGGGGGGSTGPTYTPTQTTSPTDSPTTSPTASPTASPTVTPSPETGNVSGRVITLAGDPVEGATVRISAETKTINNWVDSARKILTTNSIIGFGIDFDTAKPDYYDTTDEAGYFFIPNVPIGTWQIVGYKEGVGSFWINITVWEGQTTEVPENETVLDPTNPTPTPTPEPSPTVVPSPIPTSSPSPSPTTSPTPWEWEKDTNFGSGGEVDLSAYGQPRHPLVENTIINVPISTNVVRFNSSTGANIDTINVGITSPSVSITSNGNRAVTSFPNIKIFDSNWQNPATYGVVYSTCVDHQAKLGSNQVFLLDRGGSQEPYIEVIDTTTGQRVGNVLDIWILNPSNKYSNPGAIAVDSSGNFLITYTDDEKVIKYNSSGVQVADINSSNGFSYPSGMAINSSGYIAVIDWGGTTDRVQVFDNNLSYVGTFDTGWANAYGIDWTGNDIIITSYGLKKLARWNKK